jgi:hypothetical protein
MLRWMISLLLILVFFNSPGSHGKGNSLKSTIKPFAKGSCDADLDANPWLRIGSKPKQRGESENRVLVSVLPSYPRLFQPVEAANYRTQRSANNEVTLELIAKNERIFTDPVVDCAGSQLQVKMLNADDEVLETLSLDLETGLVRRQVKKKLDKAP